MPVAPSAPYDSLATITQMVRTLLGDFIQNIQPNNAGTVNTNGLAVTWQTGNQFTALFNGVQITINNVSYTVAAVTSPTTLTLVTSAGVQAGVAYSLVIPTGDIFADPQAYVVPTVNYAWRKLQKKLAIKGHPRLENTTILTGLPVVTDLDPGIEQYINWQGFFDGTNFQTPSTLTNCPVLPQDFISPLKLEERQSITGATPTNPNLNVFRQMHPAADGLKTRAKGSWNRYYDWREDTINFPGSVVLMDVKLRYAAFLVDIAVAGGGFAATPVPIMGCAESLANYSAEAFVIPRGGQALAPAFAAEGDEALLEITTSQSKLQQRASYHRRPWGRRFRRYGTYRY